MKHPEKWRETCDPFSLPFHDFQLLEVLGYPHAGNDVFHVRGLSEGQAVRAYLKVERQRGAAVGNEAALLPQIRHPAVPQVLDHGVNFCVTREMPGERLSMLLGENDDLASMAYMREYGRTLAWLHRQKPKARPVTDRRFFHRPPADLLEKLGLSGLEAFFDRRPGKPVTCFCHGDLHYANLLWQAGHISGILDFELAGYGNRDFDIAWAVFLRPGQKFLKTEGERQAFLDGYAEMGEYDPAAVRYYMAQAFVYFLSFSQEDRTYCDYVRQWLSEQT